MESKTIAWIGAGADMQAQKDTILAYVKKSGICIDAFIHEQSPEDKPPDKDKYRGLISGLKSEDTLIVSGLSVLGRSIHEVIRIINRIIDMNVRFIAIMQGIDLAGSSDLISRTKIEMLRMLCDVQQELVSQRTRHGLDTRKKAGIKLGRPKGSTGKSKLDPHKKDIAAMLKHKAPLSYIARVYGVTWPTVENFIRTRKLEKPTFCS